MTLSPGAKRQAAKALDAAIARLKAEYRAKLLRVLAAFEPALSPAELSAGLELRTPAAGTRGQSDVGRFVSESPRLRRSRPDTATRALIDELLAGRLLLAAQESLVPGAPRAVLVCEAREVPRLGWDWQVVDLSGKPIPERLAPRPVRTPLAVKVQAAGSGAPEAGVRRGPPRAPRTLCGRSLPAVGLGAMRLSTQGRPEAEEAEALVLAALDAGVRLFDSADSYCLDAREVGHNERLLRRALARWDGPREQVVLATKAGLIRPGGRWLPNGQPEHLKASCEASLQNLGCERLPLFQLHARHNRVPFADSVGALAELQAEGKVEHVGLCNVSLSELEEARAIVPIASVQNRCNPFEPGSFKTGLVRHCREQGITFIAHSPLGGFRKVQKTAGHSLFRELAVRHGATPLQIALAWLLCLDEGLLLIPGATRLASLQASVDALQLRLDTDDLQRLAAEFPWAAGLARPAEAEADAEGAASATSGEVVVVMGCPAAGKTSRVAPYLERGYRRLNRDEHGGRLDDLLKPLQAELATGARRFVLDNTYPTRASRARLLKLAHQYEVPARCCWIEISQAEALYNAALRVIRRQGGLPSPAELRKAALNDPNMFPPVVITTYLKRLEPPSTEEGFVEVERVPFTRVLPESHTHKALLLDFDGTLRTSRGKAPFPLQPDEVELLPRRREILSAWAARGYKLLGVSNQAAVATGQLSLEQAQACCERTVELLGLELDFVFCPHPAGAIHCWCRKPMPGMGVLLIERHRLDRSQCIMVGDMDSDRDFASNLGVAYQDAEEFFAEGG